MEIVSNIALIGINETLIFQVFSFLIFLFIINRIMFRPLRNVIDERESHIRSMQKDITAAEDQYTSLTQQIGEQESALRKEAFEIYENLEKAGNHQATEIFAATKEEIADLTKNAEKEIDAHILEARKQMQTESEALALNIMEKVLGRRLTP